jgi:hypothetical protein
VLSYTGLERLAMDKPGSAKGDHCAIDLLFYRFGVVCFANKKQKLPVVIQLIPNQSNRRSTVQ